MTSGLCDVLLVDDEQLVRQGLRHQINWEQEGFRIVGEASSGSEALDQIQALHPHIVITDIVMPIMDGEQLTRIVKTQYPGIEIIVLSSFSEYQYVRSTFQCGVADYILKPTLKIEEFIQILQRTADKIPALRARTRRTTKPYELSMDVIVDRLLAGYEVQLDHVAMKKQFPYERFWILGVELQAHHRLTSWLKEKFDKIICYSLKAYANRAVLLLNMNQSEFIRLLQSIRAHSMEHEHMVVDVRYVFTEGFERLEQLGTIFGEQFVRLLDKQFYFPDLRLLLQSELPTPIASPPVFDLKHFMDEFKRGQHDYAFLYLREHVQSITANYMATVFEFKSFLGNIIFNITILLGNLGVELKEIERLKYTALKSIDDAYDARVANEQLEVFIDAVIHCLHDRQPWSSQGNMKLLLQFIHKHYAEPLNLSDMATHFHFNPSYLSNYFSSHNQVGFSEYLNKVRIEKAEQLLQAGAASISEISSLVGYSDHSYFCKVFKRFTGFSASDYRKQYVRIQRI